MLVNLNSDLNRASKDIVNREQKKFDKSILLLEQNNNESDALLERFNINYEYDEAKKIVDKHNSFIHLKEKYNRNIYTLKMIETICDRYCLDFRLLKDFKGKVPKTMSKDIKNFCEENDIVIDTSKFWVLAPKECFMRNAYKYLNYKPCLFYFESNNIDYYNVRYGYVQNECVILLENYTPNFNIFRIIKSYFLFSFEDRYDLNYEDFKERILVRIISSIFLITLIGGFVIWARDLILLFLFISAIVITLICVNFTDTKKELVWR